MREEIKEKIKEKAFAPLIIILTVLLSLFVVLLAEKHPDESEVLMDKCYYHHTYMVGKVTYSTDYFKGDSTLKLLDSGLSSVIPLITYSGLGQISEVTLNANYLRDKIGIFQGKYRTDTFNYKYEVNSNKGDVKSIENYKLDKISEVKLSNVEVVIKVSNNAFCKLRSKVVK